LGVSKAYDDDLYAYGVGRFPEEFDNLKRACPMICKLFLRLLISVALKFINTKQELDTPTSR
jgi:hypothetical protein